MNIVDLLVYCVAMALANMGGCVAGIAQGFGNRKRFWFGAAVASVGIGIAAIWTLSKY